MSAGTGGRACAGSPAPPPPAAASCGRPARPCPPPSWHRGTPSTTARATGTGRRCRGRRCPGGAPGGSAPARRGRRRRGRA
uniref:Uncharacterized protein n=1 Tax=Arundo donax TaxID=35708 RepID=A0A0A9CYI7_ARUDO